MGKRLSKAVRRINSGRGNEIDKVSQDTIEEVGSDTARAGRLAMIQALIPLGLKAVEEELQAEVMAKVGGSRHARTEDSLKRWGRNPGSVFVGDQKVKINVPRIRDLAAGQEIRLESYERLRAPGHIDNVALSRVINGIRRPAQLVCKFGSGGVSF